MKEDLEKTKPIKILSDIKEETTTRAEKYDKDEEFSRTEKYRIVSEEIEVLNEEEAEEALAEKNIALAEELLKTEQEEKEITKEDAKAEKKKSTLKEKWNNLTKKQKIIFCVASVLILVLFVALIIFLVGKSNKKDEVVAPPKEEAPAVQFENYFYQDGTLHFLNEKDEEIGTYECANKDEKLCYIAVNNYRDDFDTALVLNEDESEKTQRIPIYDNNYVFIFDNKNETDNAIKLYSINDSEEKETYTEVKAYDDNYVIVKDTSNKYGLYKIDSDIEELIKPIYDYLGKIDGKDNLVAKNSKGYIIVDENNKVQSSPISSSYTIKDYSNNLIVVEQDKDYSVYDYKGNMIDTSYKFAKVVDKYMALVKGDKIFVKDIDKNKYNEEGIEVEHNNFVTKYIYDETGKLTETKRSFTIELDGSTLVITIYPEGSSDGTYHNLDTNIAKVNANYKYLNYFDGTLYFYNDIEKEKLIGNYKCSNANETFTDNKLTTCAPANDTIYENNATTTEEEKDRKSTTPLINNRFVFISDGTDNIVLYNLVDKKTMGTYKSVNTYTKNNNYTFDSYSGKVVFTALNKKGLYGVNTIENNSVSSTHAFNYNKIEKYGDYYLVKTTNDESQLIYNKDEKSPTFKGTIEKVSDDKKYYIVKEDDKKYLYNDEGTKITEDAFDHIELNTIFFVGINSSKELYIYDYSGKKINSTAYKVGDYSYTGEKPAYKVSYENGTYKVSIYNGETYDEQSFIPGESAEEVESGNSVNEEKDE